MREAALWLYPLVSLFQFAIVQRGWVAILVQVAASNAHIGGCALLTRTGLLQRIYFGTATVFRHVGLASDIQGSVETRRREEQVGGWWRVCGGAQR
jgi:hypothetical protein